MATGNHFWLDCIAGIWGNRKDRYSELRSQATTGLPRVEMSYIGG
jgi:cyclic pyranopterin phosphate synthase